jgi:hypothetical protein
MDRIHPSGKWNGRPAGTSHFKCVCEVSHTIHRGGKDD